MSLSAWPQSRFRPQAAVARDAQNRRCPLSCGVKSAPTRSVQRAPVHVGKALKTRLRAVGS
jgi:hypothetical protein